VDHPADPGGLTKYGISQRAYPHIDIRNLTVEGATEIYYKDYVLGPKFHLLPKALQDSLIDFGVNAGPETATKALQRAVKASPDGKLGPETLGKLGRRPLEGVLLEFTVERLLHYLLAILANPSLKTFARGWLRRTLHVFTRTMKTLLLALLLFIQSPVAAQPVSVPNQKAAVTALADQHPEAWRCAHTERACAHDFIKVLASYLHYEVDPRFGLNGKRGDPNNLSWDAINFCGGGPGHDPTGRCPSGLTVIDVIGGAGGPNPTPAWIVFDTLPGPGAWVKPERVHDTGSPRPPTPSPSPAPTPQPAPVIDLSEVLTKLEALVTQQRTLTQSIEALEAHLGRVEEQVHKNGNEVLESKQLLLNPPTYKSSIFGRGLTLRPESR